MTVTRTKTWRFSDPVVWLFGLDAPRQDHAFWARAAAATARLLLPHYERAFRGDLRPRAGLEAAEALAEGDAPEARATAERLRARVAGVRCGGGVAGAAADAARWALQTALATHAAPRGPLHQASRDETDW